VIAHDASWIDGKIKSGTVAAVECCFGAELYDPKKAGGRLGIGQTYMACGSTAYVGSTNSAYGPEKGNDNADLICRYFLEEVLNGRSSGDAFLTARLRYVKSAPPPFDAIDLKTLSQFILLGDPSIHPVLLAGPAAPKRTAMHGTAIRNPSADGFPAFRLARKGRRRKAATQARVLAATAPVGSVPIGPPAAPIAKILREALEKAGTGGPRILTRSFGTVIGAGPDRKKAKGKGSDIRVHIAKAPAAKPKVLRKGSLLASHAPKPPVVVIREIDGKVLDLKTLYVKSTPDSPGHRC
jgi:hypothetical protein